MPSRRVLVLLACTVIVAGAVASRWWSGRESAPDGALVRTLAAVAAHHRGPIAVVSEDAGMDRLIQTALREADVPAASIVPRDVDRVASAARDGTLLAAQRGRDYLEMLGYELSWIRGNGGAELLPLARVDRRLRCASVKGDAWSPLPGLEYTGRLGIVLPAARAGAMLLVVGDDLPLDVDVAAADGAHVRMKRERFPTVAEAPPDYWIEGRSPREAPKAVQRITLFASPERGRVLSVRLGRRAPRVLARLGDYPADARASVCASPVSPDVAFAGTASDFVLSKDADAHFGAGWSDVLPVSGVGTIRWMGQHGVVLVPFARRGAVRVVLGAFSPPESSEGTVALKVNDLVETPALQLRAGASRYEWTVPKSAWVAGTNEILLLVSAAGGDRLLGFERLELALVP